MASGVANGITDLNRFLYEVGTDPREARYWLKQFKHQDGSSLFAVVQVEHELFQHKVQLEKFASCLSFLQRHQMRCVVVHGQTTDNAFSLDGIANARASLKTDAVLLTNLLETHGAAVRPLFDGAGIVSTSLLAANKANEDHITINADLITWCLDTERIPIIPAIGVTSQEQTTIVDPWLVTSEIAKGLLPLKVMHINTTGGFLNDKGQVVANVNLPGDTERYGQLPWYSTSNRRKTEQFFQLLQTLPRQTSVVITSANNMLKELFSHHGCGTFFKISQQINASTSLDGMDLISLGCLINSSFGQKLKDSYWTGIGEKLSRIYLSDECNAVAVVTDEGAGVPYLDKFAVSLKTQGEGTGEMVWDRVRADYKKLFWRSRTNNPINAWYFSRCDGSWMSDDWTVFWYGVRDIKVAAKLIDIALSLDNSFVK